MLVESRKTLEHDVKVASCKDSLDLVKVRGEGVIWGTCLLVQATSNDPVRWWVMSLLRRFSGLLCLLTFSTST